MSVKAVRRTLMKLSPGAYLTNILLNSWISTLAPISPTFYNEPFLDKSVSFKVCVCNFWQKKIAKKAFHKLSVIFYIKVLFRDFMRLELLFIRQKESWL